MAKSRAIAAVLALVLIFGACSDSKPAADAASSSAPASSAAPASVAPALAAPACNRPHTAGQTTATLDFQGQARTYELFVPRSYDGTTAVPVVFNFHGFGSTAKQQMVYGNFMPLAERDDFLIVAPDGQGEGINRHFNLTGERNLQDDLAMVQTLLDHIEATFCVDTKRVYSTGMSDGGAMTSFLACRASDRFAAFGPVAVVVFVPGCAPTRPIPIAAFSGTDDPVVPFNGGQVHCCGGVSLQAAPDTMAAWANFNGCDPAFTDNQLDTEVTQRIWTGCTGGEVVFYIINGGGHTWPGSIPVERLGKTTTQIDASATIWDFFKSHPLP